MLVYPLNLRNGITRICFTKRTGMRLLLIILIGLLSLLHYQLWLSESQSVPQLRRLTMAVQEQTAENAVLTERNQALEAEVSSLKEGLEAMEERARVELGMIRKDETFFRILENPPPSIVTKR